MYVYTNAPKPMEKEKPTPKIEQTTKIGIVDISAIDKYGELSMLDKKERRIRQELADALKPLIISSPNVSSEPFDASVWQKQAQALISKRAAIETKAKRAATEYKKSTEAEYLRKRDEMTATYQNEIVNLKLKLENAKTMKLNDEEMATMQARIEELQKERGEKQMELQEQWIKEIDAASQAAVADDLEQLKSEATRLIEAERQSAALSKEQSIKRNQTQMEEAQAAMIERQERRQTLLGELSEVMTARNAAENKMNDTIEDAVAKLATIYNLKLVLINRELTDDEKYFPYKFDEKYEFDELFKHRKMGAEVFGGVNVIDLTEELKRELSEG